MNKLKYLMFLALALMLSVGGWAQGHQRYTSAVNLSFGILTTSLS